MKLAKQLDFLKKMAVHSFLIMIALIFLLPFLRMIAISLESPAEIFSYPLHLFPTQFVYQNYINLFDVIPFAIYYMNSAIVTASYLSLSLFFCSLAGYAFARLYFPFKLSLFLIMLSSLMIPIHARIIPLYLLMHKIHWIDTYYGIVLPFCANAFGIFLMRQYVVASLPSELLDAARIDGCSEFMIYIKVVLPLTKPALATLAIYLGVESWNWFLWPLIVINSPDLYVLPIGLANLFDVHQQQYGILMAGSFLAIIPLVTLFLILQRQFIKGITLGAVKG